MKNPIVFNMSSTYRAGRGGSWDGVAWGPRVPYRDWRFASFRDDDLGFRIFRTKVES